MEPEGSLPGSQEPSTGPILSQSNPIHTIPFSLPGPRLFEHLRNKLIFYSEELLAPRPSPNPCRLSATTYSIYSQQPSIPGGRLLHPRPEDVPCRGDKGPTWYGTYELLSNFFCEVRSLRYADLLFVRGQTARGTVGRERGRERQEIVVE
jgi:hypothetical protein